jgi:hypothetical protein
MFPDTSRTRRLVLTDCRRDGVLCRRAGQVGQGMLVGRAAGPREVDRQQRPGFKRFANQSATMRRAVAVRFFVKHGNCLSVVFGRYATKNNVSFAF